MYKTDVFISAEEIKEISKMSFVEIIAKSVRKW